MQPTQIQVLRTSFLSPSFMCFKAFLSCFMQYFPGGCTYYLSYTYYLTRVYRSAIGVLTCQMLPFECILICLRWHVLFIALKQYFFPLFFLNIGVHPDFGTKNTIIFN